MLPLVLLLRLVGFKRSFTLTPREHYLVKLEQQRMLQRRLEEYTGRVLPTDMRVLLVFSTFPVSLFAGSIYFRLEIFCGDTLASTLVWYGGLDLLAAFFLLRRSFVLVVIGGAFINFLFSSVFFVCAAACLYWSFGGPSSIGERWGFQLLHLVDVGFFSLEQLSVTLAILFVSGVFWHPKLYQEPKAVPTPFKKTAPLQPKTQPRMARVAHVQRQGTLPAITPPTARFHRAEPAISQKTVRKPLFSGVPILEEEDGSHTLNPAGAIYVPV